MSQDWKKTGIFAAVALVLSTAAALTAPTRYKPGDVFEEQGKPLFARFEPTDCTSLEVIDYNEETASATPFKVMLKDKLWVIPSHYDYPADAKDRLSKTASGVTDLVKDTVRSTRTEDHEAFGVIDPLDSKAPLKGRGKRVTLRNKSDVVLADLIIGKEVPGRPGQRYVRLPDKKLTYGINLNVDLSIKFNDWIETNLLKIDTAKLRRIDFDRHKVDPEQGILIRGENDRYSLTRENGTAPWTLNTAVPEGQEINTDKVSALTSAVGDLKIVGVRPKPEILSRDLKAKANDIDALKTQPAVRSLASKGFYLTRDGLFSNQGEVKLAGEDGVVYTLRFGEVFFAEGDELTAGSDDSKSASAEAKDKDAAKAKGAGQEARYLFVTAAFDKSLIPPGTPPPPEEPTVEEVFDSPFVLAPDDPKRAEQEKKEKERMDTFQKSEDQKIADAEKKAKELSDRFADWYYVISGDSFRTIGLEKTALVRPKGEKPPGQPMPGLGGPEGFPGLGGGQFPPGMSPHP